jgi:hypothetical protein
MTSERDIDRVLDHWFTERSTLVADRVLDEIADRIARQPQQPAWRLRLWRFPTMSAPIKLVAVGVALLVVLVGGAVFLGGGAAPRPTPSPAPTPASSPIACEDDLPGCAGMLMGGSHRSTSLVPPLKYETTGGLWANVIDSADIYKIDSMSDPTPGHPSIIVWTDASITDQEVPCSDDPDPARGRAAADWIELVTTHPGLVVTNAIELTISGRPARQFELSVAPDWTQTCPGHTGPYVMLLTQRVEDQVAEYGVPADERLLLTVMDVGQRTVVIQSYGPTDATAFDRTMEPIKAVIESFVMCGPSMGRPCGGPGAPSGP